MAESNNMKHADSDNSNNNASGGLTHLDSQGNARMVDVGSKDETRRIAVASAVVRTRPDVIRMIQDGDMPKGDVLAVARVSGIMAAKKTPNLIPLCHPIQIDSVEIDLTLDTDSVHITSTTRTTGKTGVEMEALTAASVAALAIYDMCKAVDRAMVIEQVQLESKSGGKSGVYER